MRLRGLLLLAASTVVVLGSVVVPAPARPEATGPNIVVILSDDQSIDSLPNHVSTPMPYLQSLVDDPSGHWIRYSRAFDNTALCCPARATLLSGQYSHHTGVQRNTDGALFDDTSTVATWLHDGGYHTGFVGKYLNQYPFGLGDYIPPGWDDWHAYKGNPTYYDYDLEENGQTVSYGSSEADYATDILSGKAVDFLSQAPGTKPFFLWFAPYGPHHDGKDTNGNLIWNPAPRDKGAFDGMAPIHHPDFNETDVSDKPGWVQKLPLLDAQGVNQMDTDRQGEYETLLSVDDAVKAVVQELDAKGVLDNTVILYLTDNAFSFGEHRWETKTCEYDECQHIVFYVRDPAASTRTDKTHLVSTVDVAPTVAELAGVTPTRTQDGMSLVPLLTGQRPPWRKGVLLRWAASSGRDRPLVDPEREDFSEFDVTPFWGVRTLDYLYTELNTGEKELYDLNGKRGSRDPYSLDNRAGNPDYALAQARLAALLQQLKGTQRG